MQREQGSIKPYTMAGFILLGVIVQYLLLIVSVRFTSNTAAGLMAPAAVYYFGAWGVFLVAVRKRVYRFVRIYHNNGFYINAKESSRNAILKTAALTVPVALVTVLLARPLSEAVCASVKARLPLYASALCAILMGVEGVLFGFAEGMGKKKTVLTLDILRTALTVLAGIPLAFAGYRYGKKLDDLLFSADNTALYTVLFVFLGFLCAEALTILLLLVVRASVLRKLEPLHETGKPRYLGEPPSLYTSCGPFMLATLLPVFPVLTGCVFLCMHPGAEAGAAEVTALCGSFAGRFALVVTLAGCLSALPFIEHCYRIPGMNDDIDTGEAGIRYRRMIHRQSILCFPVGMFMTALAEPLQTAVFGLPDDTASLLTGTCGLAATGMSFGITVCLLLVLTKRRARLVSSCIISAFAGTGCGFVLIVLLNASAVGASGALTAALALFVITGLSGLNRLFIPERGMVRGEVVKPFLLSAVSALAVYLVSAFLVHVIGEVPTCIVCFFGGSLIYLSLMAFFRGFEPGDLTAVPLGRLFTGISMRGRTARE